MEKEKKEKPIEKIQVVNELPQQNVRQYVTEDNKIVLNLETSEEALSIIRNDLIEIKEGLKKLVN